MGFDWPGFSVFITSASVGTATLVNVWIAVRNSNLLVRAEEERLATERNRHQAEIERTIKETKNAGVLEKIEQHVNGLNDKIAAGAFARGKESGIQEERAAPMVPAEKS